MELLPPPWEPRGPSPELLSGEAHIWRVYLDRGGSWAQWLLPAERERLGRFRFEEDALREAAGRGALRLLLGTYLGIPPLEVGIGAGPKGKPGLTGDASAARVEFNLSHSGQWALLAFARGLRVGIDIEAWRKMPGEPVLRGCLRPEEYEEWARRPEGERPAAFFEMWTLKEAFVKALGDGLSKPLNSFGVRVGAGGEAELSECADDPGAPARWRLLRLQVGPGYSAAFAAERGLARVATRTLAL